MKKIIMFKMGRTELNRASPDSLDSSPSPNISSSEAAQLDVQPPLPLEPPPQDELYPLYVKQEIDKDYESTSSEVIPVGIQNPEPINKTLNIISEQPELCRDFIRGTCQRPGTCRYAHTFDPSQLVGVYTFCRKYQNSVCTLQNCRYVHATIFEEQQFYRTGTLPPQALAHQQKVNVMLPLIPPPPPPPPPPRPRPPPAPPAPPPLLPRELPSSFWVNTNVSMNPTLANLPPSLNNKVFQEGLSSVPSRRNKLKREWNIIEQNFSSSSSDRYTNENFAIECKNCHFMDFRVQFHEEKVEEMLLAKEVLKNKMCSLEKQKENLCSIMLAFLMSSSKTHSNGQGFSFLGNQKKRRCWRS